MKFEFKGKRVGKGLALAGTLALCLVLTGCYIPPDEIAAGTTNMTVGSNNLPFDTFAPATDIPTQVPTQVPTDAPSQPTINWDDWGTTVTTNTPNPNAGGNGTIVVVTQQPTNTPNPNAPTATPASSSLKNGSSGTEVRKVQQRLKELGYLSGSADGDFGDATEAAVRAFQQANGLDVDGKVGKQTLAKLNSNNAVSAKNSGNTIAVVTKKPSATNTPKPTKVPDVSNTYLDVGASGTKVRTLQQRLIALGYLAGSADGEYGGATQAAVKAFQERVGEWADGVAGPKTLEKLYSSSAKKANSVVAVVGKTLEEGMNGNDVRALQKRLKELGYLSGSIDGDYGNATKTAVTAFQLNNGLRADGKAGTATMNKLFEEDLVKESESKDNNTTISSTGYVVLEEGSEGDAVRKLQKALKELGYYSGSVDGSYGSGTAGAVMAFQRANDITVDGKAGPTTQRVLYGTGTSITYSTLREGDSGSAVRNLQHTLYELGYYDGKIDGDYGATTRDAVRAFQIQNKLSPVDGVAGNKTLQKLYSSSAKAAAATATEFETLRKGDAGNEVVEMQDCLMQLGYLAEITGEYDNATVAAVKLFQQTNGLSPVDGVAGNKTLQKLYSGNAKAYIGN
ncbi:MAG: peptidoglycan-binding protein [Clostridia bacterium]|nr:peptidoglycan-binding protein [Clostridia bacterium]